VRSTEQVAAVARLAERGLNDTQIAAEAGIPRTTVRDWRRRGFRAGGPGTRLPAAFDACQGCGAAAYGVEALPATYAYLLGLYLGDGCLSRHRRGVSRLRITLDSRYPIIVADCKAAIREVMPTNRTSVVLRIGCVDVSCYSRHWPCLLPQHGPGPKHEREIALTEWQRRICDRHPDLLLRGLIHSDGCRVINRIRTPAKVYAYPRYEFTNASTDIQGVFCRYCDVLGIAWRQMKPRAISIARKDAVAKLDAFVGPKA
jgi:hypothetical protein